MLSKYQNTKSGKKEYRIRYSRPIVTKCGKGFTVFGICCKWVLHNSLK